MQESLGKIAQAQNSRSALIFVPSIVATDSTFPFKKLPAHCKVRINGNQLIVEAAAEAP